MSSLPFRTFACIAAIVLTAGAAGAQNLSLPTLVEGDVGSMINVPVSVSNAPNLVDAYGFRIDYDPAVLSFTEFTFGEIVEGFSFNDDNSPMAGQLIIAGFTVVAGTEIMVGESGLLGTATFEVLSCPEMPSPITLSNVVDDMATWTTQDGSFECEMVVNTPPVAEDFTVNTDEDEPVSFSLQAMDADGDPLTYVIASGPANGTLMQLGDSASVTYTPDENFNGMDSFTYFVDDGVSATKVTSNTATVTINVAPVNDPPVASPTMRTTLEDSPIGFDLTATDVDGDPLTFMIVSNASNGTAVLVGSGPTVNYTPDPDFNSMDSFTFRANDGTANSNTATVTIEVTPVNDPPIAQNTSAETDEDGAVNVMLQGTDVDGDPLSFSIVSGPSDGSLGAISGNSVTYTPDPEFSGMDSFTYRANDGTVNSNTATATITVDPVNDDPDANNVSVATPQDTPVVVTFDATDVDGDALSFSIGAGPSNGSLGAVAGDQVTYTPNASFIGMDSFTYIASDGNGGSDTATVMIDVQQVGECSVSLSSESGVPGEMVRFDLDVNNSPEIDAFGVELLYDTAVLDFQGFADTMLTDLFTQLGVNETEDGHLVVSGSTTGDPIPAGSTGTLIFLDFLVVGCPGGVANAEKGLVIPFSALDLVEPVGDVSDCDLIDGSFTCENRAPEADAGEDVVGAATGEKVTLDGTASFDPDGDFITFAWVIDSAPAGSTAVLELANTPTPCITPDVPGAYVICLTVDDFELTDTDCVTIMAVDVQAPCPVADAAEDQSACVGEEVCLDGTGSFDPFLQKGIEPVLEFLWEFDTAPQDSQATFDDPTSPTPCFTPDVEGLYTLKLTVSNGLMCDNPEASMDFVDVTATLNAPPNADAGADQEVLLGDLVVLDASASDDPDDMPDPLSFAWSFVSVADGSALGNADIANSTQAVASFLPDVPGVYVARVEVSDGKDTDGDNVMITVGNKVKQDVTELFDIMTSNGQSVLDPITRLITSTKDLMLENASDITVCAPVQVVVSVSEAAVGDVDMPNADGVNEDGDFLFDLQGDVGPADMAEFELMFEFPAGVSFLFEVQICGFIVEFPAEQDEGILFSSTAN